MKTKEILRMILTAQVHNDMKLWRHLIHYLAAIPNHLR